MSKNKHEASEKMDESFGTAPETNVKSAPSISPNSEDDKESAKKVDLTLDNEQPSTNDAPQQKVDDKVNPAVQFESLRTLSDEKLAQAKQDLDDMEKEVHHYAENIEDEYEEQGGIKGIAKEKADELKENFENDPVNTLCDLGKKALMVIGGFAVLKAIYKK